jgi:hypothetical protein
MMQEALKLWTADKHRFFNTELSDNCYALD